MYNDGNWVARPPYANDDLCSPAKPAHSAKPDVYQRRTKVSNRPSSTLDCWRSQSYCTAVRWRTWEAGLDNAERSQNDLRRQGNFGNDDAERRQRVIDGVGHGRRRASRARRHFAKREGVV